MSPFNAYPTITLEEAARYEYDYIVVGGGTAGCVLARRLCEIPGTSVLLLERGPARDTWLSRVPLLSSEFAAGDALTSYVNSAPMANLGGRAVEVAAGRALGGTSRINSMMYTRGLKAEVDAWAAQGRKGWGFEDVLPTFRKSEGTLDGEPKAWQGSKGPWQTMKHDTLHFPASSRFRDAASKLSIPAMDDVNSPDAPSIGTSRIHFTINTKGERHSTFHAFLPKEFAIAHRDMLNICIGAVATKLDVSAYANGELRAVGVLVRPERGSSKIYRLVARREVIVACGALDTPKLLMLSGIGPADHLTAMGIAVHKELPAVGQNLQDHMGLPVEFQIPLADSWLALVKRPWRLLGELWKYVVHGRGLFLAPIAELALWMQSDCVTADGTVRIPDSGADGLPDFEIIPESICDPRPPEFDRSKGVFCLLISILRPRSTGSVILRSADPADTPHIDLAYLSAPEDWEVCRAALRLAIRLAREMRRAGYAIDEVPGHVPAAADGMADGDLDAFVRRWARTLYHYSSTCRMAPEPDGVVDDELRVHGVAGLRIADASVFPSIPATHPQAAVVMVAEKCAELIRQGRR